VINLYTNKCVRVIGKVRIKFNLTCDHDFPTYLAAFLFPCLPPMNTHACSPYPPTHTPTHPHTYTHTHTHTHTHTTLCITGRKCETTATSSPSRADWQEGSCQYGRYEQLIHIKVHRYSPEVRYHGAVTMHKTALIQLVATYPCLVPRPPHTPPAPRPPPTHSSDSTSSYVLLPCSSCLLHGACTETGYISMQSNSTVH